MLRSGDQVGYVCNPPVIAEGHHHLGGDPFKEAGTLGDSICRRVLHSGVLIVDRDHAGSWHRSVPVASGHRFFPFGLLVYA